MTRTMQLWSLFLSGSVSYSHSTQQSFLKKSKCYIPWKHRCHITPLPPHSDHLELYKDHFQCPKVAVVKRFSQLGLGVPSSKGTIMNRAALKHPLFEYNCLKGDCQNMFI